jgi:LCP family protein required for cell wall assembly
VPTLALPSDVEVSVLLGSDEFSPNLGRTDTLILVFSNISNGRVSLVSFPRDLYVYLPGYGMERINTAYVWGSTEMLYLTLEYNFGVRPRHWALLHLDDFIRMVDDLGGIEVPVSTPLPDDCGGIPDGTVHMDGGTALCYIRSRMYTNDFERIRRQQEVLQIIFQRVFTVDAVARLPEWYASYQNTALTDLSFTDLVALVPFALRLYDGGGVHMFEIGGDEVIEWKMPISGAELLLPRSDKIAAMLQAALDALKEPAPISDLMATRLAAMMPSPTPTDIPLVPETETPTPETIPTDTPLPITTESIMPDDQQPAYPTP